MRALAKFIDTIFSFFLVKFLLSKVHYYQDPKEFNEEKKNYTVEKAAQLYAKPDRVPDIENNLKFIERRNNYSIYEFEFDSEMETEAAENNIVYGKYFICGDGFDKDTLILIPGWLTINYGLFEDICETVAPLGYNSIIFDLPYHLKRTPKGTFSGELAISGNVIRNAEVAIQAVSDIRQIINFLDGNSGKKMGIFGISLGGMIGSILTCFEERLDFSILALPAVSPEDILFNTKLCQTIKKDILDSGLKQDEVGEFFRIAEPLSFQPKVPKEKILILEAIYDTVVHNYTVEQLWQEWGCPNIVRTKYGHMSNLFAKRFRKEIYQFLKTLC